MDRAEHLRRNRWLTWDYCLGLRGAGLIVYGALPASLGALGAFKAPDQNSLQLSIYGVPFVVGIAMAPVALTFLLTRQRLSAWYLLRDYLFLRSALITIGIIMTSTAVCIATRVLSKPDVSAAYHQWLGQDWPNHLNTVWHALLLSFAYLVGSSTLFLTVIKEDGGLPLLPNKEQLTNEAELRKRLKETVATARDLPLEVPDKPLAERVNQLSEDIQEAKQAVDSLRKLATKLGRVQFYREIVEEFDALRLAAQDVAGAQDAANVRNKYWSATAPANLNPVEVERRRKVQRHAGLSVVG